MQVRVTVQQELPLGWTKTFSSGLLIPTTVQNSKQSSHYWFQKVTIQREGAYFRWKENQLNERMQDFWGKNFGFIFKNEKCFQQNWCIVTWQCMEHWIFRFKNLWSEKNKSVLKSKNAQPIWDSQEKLLNFSKKNKSDWGWGWKTVGSHNHSIPFTKLLELKKPKNLVAKHQKVQSWLKDLIQLFEISRKNPVSRKVTFIDWMNSIQWQNTGNFKTRFSTNLAPIQASWKEGEECVSVDLLDDRRKTEKYIGMFS